MAYDPITGMMDVILPDGAPGLRRCDRIERIQTQIVGRPTAEWFCPQPELLDGEVIRWTVGSSVPYIVRVRESSPPHFDPSFGSYEGF